MKHPKIIINAEEAIKTFMDIQDAEEASNLMKFFKTGKGEYGEGDQFLGVKVPVIREVVGYVYEIPLKEIETLVISPFHEIRMAGYLFLVKKIKKALRYRKKGTFKEHAEEVVRFYMEHSSGCNNWDLVDLSAPGIIGNWLLYTQEDRSLLDALAQDENLWHKRMGIVSTLTLVRTNQLEDTLRIAEILLPCEEDLIQKATGWLLREVGKRDKECLRNFLQKHLKRISRTTLRYAIEKMNAEERFFWMKK